MSPPVSHLPANAQTCYRHPDRETGVRCTRCDRPICPECMTAASVGFQCPECLREGRKSVRQARTIAGAPVTADSPVTRVLLAVNVGIFVLVFLGIGGDILGRFGMSPPGIAINGDYYRLITAAFLHQQFFHIGFNMYALLMLGDQVERVLGRWRYIALYLTAALSGSAASYFFGQPNVLSIGASGAIFGLFGALFVIQRRLRADTGSIMVVLLLNLFIGFVVPGIDWRAHLGGLVAGAAITAGYLYVGRGSSRTPIHVAVVAVVLAATVAVVGLRTQQLRDLFLGPAQASSGTSTGQLTR